MDKKKTIVIAHNYSEISFASMSYHFSHYLSELGYRVIFISHFPYISDKQVIENGKGEIIVCSWSSDKRPKSINDFILFIKIYLKYKPEIVIGHFIGSNIAVSVSKLMSFGKVKTFQYYHTLTTQILYDLHKNSVKQKLLFIRKKFFYKLFCDLIICPSALAKKDLEEFYKIEKGRIILNPMLDRFKSKAVISSDAIIVSFLGRFDPSKGIVDLIKAFEIYQNQKSNSKIILNIAGLGMQETEILGLINSNPSIHYFGLLEYEKIDKYLNESHFTIIPSVFDNLPTVGLESLMNQTPLLISKSTGLAEYLEDGFDCFKFDPNIDSMVAMFNKIENNFSSNHQMGLNARLTFLNKFNIPNYCNDFLKIIE